MVTCTSLCDESFSGPITEEYFPYQLFKFINRFCIYRVEIDTDNTATPVPSDQLSEQAASISLHSPGVAIVGLYHGCAKVAHCVPAR